MCELGTPNPHMKKSIMMENQANKASKTRESNKPNLCKKKSVIIENQTKKRTQSAWGTKTRPMPNKIYYKGMRWRTLKAHRGQKDVLWTLEALKHTFEGGQMIGNIKLASYHFATSMPYQANILLSINIKAQKVA